MGIVFFDSLEFDSDCLQQCPKECTTVKYEILLNNPDMDSDSPND